MRRIGGSFDFCTVQHNTVRYGTVRYVTSQTLYPKPYIQNDDNGDIIDENMLLLMLMLIMLKMMSVIDNDDGDDDVDDVDRLGC